jgi:Ner family transcriptional regulator
MGATVGSTRNASRLASSGHRRSTKKRGHSLANLSLSHGYHATAAGKALKEPWPSVELIIAAALERRPQDIWPSRYTDDGSPLPRSKVARD